MADHVDHPRGCVVKHYADPSVLSEENRDLPLGHREGNHVRQAASKGTRFLMDKDYLDDPRRPGAVLGPTTNPKRTADLLREELVARQDVRCIHEENVVALYGERP